MTRANNNIPMKNVSRSSNPRGRISAGVFLTALVFSVSGVPGLAAASEVLPSELQEVTEVDCLPSCSNCHTTEPGRAGTATKRLPQLLLGNDRLQLSDGSEFELTTPLDLAQPESLQVAYASLDGAGNQPVDGIITEPATGAVIFDPAAAACQAEVDYGCSIESSTPSGREPVAWWAAALMSLFGLGVIARRRRPGI